MSPMDHTPDDKFVTLYEGWGTGGWGAILTGNIMVDENHCGTPGDLVVRKQRTEEEIERWRRYAAACQAGGSPTMAQLNHPGRQSPLPARGSRGFWEKTLAPSAIPLNFGNGMYLFAATD